MKIILEKEDVLKLMYNAMANGGLVELQHSGVSLEIDSNQYSKAKDKLLERNSGIICREDVWLEVFKNYGLLFIDEEGGEELDVLTVDLALQNLQEAIDTDLTHDRFNYMIDSLKEDGQDDAYTHWYILQMALYKDVIFG
jgi:hypothetical protein